MGYPHWLKSLNETSLCLPKIICQILFFSLPLFFKLFPFIIFIIFLNLFLFLLFLLLFLFSFICLLIYLFYLFGYLLFICLLDLNSPPGLFCFLFVLCPVGPFVLIAHNNPAFMFFLLLLCIDCCSSSSLPDPSEHTIFI